MPCSLNAIRLGDFRYAANRGRATTRSCSLPSRGKFGSSRVIEAAILENAEAAETAWISATERVTGRSANAIAFVR